MSTGEPSSPRRKVRRRRRSAPGAQATAATRVEILQSAARAFRRLGYHGATVEQIATTLRMKKGNLYYYFRNKEAILFACHQYSLDRLIEVLDQVRVGGGTPADRLRALMVAAVHISLDELHGTALFLPLEALSPSHQRTVVGRRDAFDQGMRQLIAEGIEAGAFEADDVKLASFAILGAINWIPRWFRPDGPSSSGEVAERFATYLLRGLAKVR